MFKRILSDIHVNELLKGSAIALIFKIFGILIQYFFFWVLAKYFNAQGVGVFSILWTIMVVLTVFSKLGFDTAIVKIIATYITTGKNNLIPGTYKKVFCLVIVAALLLIVLISSGSGYISMLFFDNRSFVNNILIISAAVLPLTLMNINAEVFKSFKKITLFSVFQNGSIYALASVFVIAGYFIYQDEKLMVVSVLISVLILYIISQLLIKKQLLSPFKNVFKNDTSLNNTDDTHGMFKMALPMLLSNSLFLVLSWTDTLMLGAFEDEANVGIYNIALKIAALNTIILVGVNSIAMPKYAELFAKKEISGLRTFVKQTTLLIFSLSFPILLVIVLFPGFLLGLFGNEFTAGINTLLILTAGQAFSSFSSSSISLLNMTGFEIKARNILIFTVLINATLNYILIPRYGISGAATATASSTILWNILAVMVIYKNFKFTTYPINTGLFKRK